ncbi:MAG: formyl transferase [Halieaceae bacterium]
MNITVLANRDLASNYALNLLLPTLAADHSVQVYLSSAVGGTGQRPQELQQLKFFEQTLFNELLFPLLPATRGGALCSFEQLGQYTRTPIAELNRINSPQGLAQLRQSQADLILSIRYGGILKEEAIASAALGVINLHSGLLPDYRGVMATFRALLAGEREIGMTLHYISDPGIDTGAIIATTALPVEAGRSYLWHVLALYPEGCKKLLGCVASLAAGETLDTSPQAGEGQYFSFPEQPELDAFRARGLKLFDAEEITNFAQRYTGTQS